MAEASTLPESETYRTEVRPAKWEDHHDVAAKNGAKRRATTNSHDLATLGQR